MKVRKLSWVWAMGRAKTWTTKLKMYKTQGCFVTALLACPNTAPAVCSAIGPAVVCSSLGNSNQVPKLSSCLSSKKGIRFLKLRLGFPHFTSSVAYPISGFCVCLIRALLLGWWTRGYWICWFESIKLWEYHITMDVPTRGNLLCPAELGLLGAGMLKKFKYNCSHVFHTILNLLKYTLFLKLRWLRVIVKLVVPAT